MYISAAARLLPNPFVRGALGTKLPLNRRTIRGAEETPVVPRAQKNRRATTRELRRLTALVRPKEARAIFSNADLLRFALS